MWTVKPKNVEKEKFLVDNGAGAFLARLLSQRNIKAEDYNSFLDAKYENLSDPYSLTGVEKAVQIFVRNVKEKKKILVSSDYDSDGVCSATIIFEACRAVGYQCSVFLPSRFEHGYGLNDKTIATLKSKYKTAPDLLIVLDCGTSNFKEVAILKEWGVKEVIIIDHHIPNNDTLSTNADVLINWHLVPGYNEMCATGEAFQFIRGLRKVTKKIDPIEFLTYAAIGTIADSSPIVGDNRIIVKNGLGEYALNHVSSVGLKSLMGACKMYSNHLTQMDVSFQIAPRINATGRMEKPDYAFKLFTEYNMSIVDELVLKVNDLNSQRKQLQALMESQAIEKLNKESFSNGVMLMRDSWHIGIIGNVASRVAEKCNKPTLILGFYDGKWKGSGRTVNGINLKEILDSCSYIFERYGGHSGAIGCALKPEYVDSAPKIFDEACSKYVGSQFKSDVRYFDASLKIDLVDKETAILINDKLAPYCKDHNPEPIFKLSNVWLYGVNIKEGEGWRIMMFNVANKEKNIPYTFKCFSPRYGSELEGQKVNLYFTFPQKWDESQKFGQFELTVVDVEQVD